MKVFQNNFTLKGYEFIIFYSFHPNDKKHSTDCWVVSYSQCKCTHKSVKGLYKCYQILINVCSCIVGLQSNLSPLVFKHCSTQPFFTSLQPSRLCIFGTPSFQLAQEECSAPRKMGTYPFWVHVAQLHQFLSKSSGHCNSPRAHGNFWAPILYLSISAKFPARSFPI